jgi:hypothetical protein
LESIIKKALKTYKIKFKKRIVCINFVLLVLLFCGSVALAQVNEQKQDTTKLVIIGKVQIKNPQSVLSAYTYDRLPTDIFILIQLMGFH